jgi:hypothetical protein
MNFILHRGVGYEVINRTVNFVTMRLRHLHYTFCFVCACVRVRAADATQSADSRAEVN